MAAQKAAELQDVARAKAAELYTQVCCWVCRWVAWLQSTAVHHLFMRNRTFGSRGCLSRREEMWRKFAHCGKAVRAPSKPA